MIWNLIKIEWNTIKTCLPPLKLTGCLCIHLSQQNAKKQYLCIHWQKIAQQAWKIAQTWQFDNILSEPSMRMTCSFSHFTTGKKRQVVLSMFKKLPRWETDNLFRCYEKSIIDQEILKMRRTKEWEETKQSILSAKELVRFLYFSLMFFFL